jgi:hypothetical protein
MGQLLSAQATRQIPSLKNAFFVGDVLTKRDCLRLQSLATNVRIINMYDNRNSTGGLILCDPSSIRRFHIFVNAKGHYASWRRDDRRSTLGG